MPCVSSRYYILKLSLIDCSSLSTNCSYQDGGIVKFSNKCYVKDSASIAVDVEKIVLGLTDKFHADCSEDYHKTLEKVARSGLY